MIRHWRASLVLAALLGLGTACSGTPPSATPETAEEQAEFQQEILADLDKVDIFLQKTQRGVNLSEFNLGWFTMILLNELASHDQDLFDHLHRNGMNVEYYLRQPFQTNPTGEIAALDAMARRGNTAIRLSARHALEMLTQIPSSSESADLQAQSRRDLAATLAKLRQSLSQVARDAAPPAGQ